MILQMTFAALLFPIIQPFLQRTQIYDRSGQSYKVLNQYAGWGTVAYRGFQKPSWLPGLLCEVEAPQFNGESRFAFVWHRSEETGTSTVLTWVAIQDQFPLLLQTSPRTDRK